MSAARPILHDLVHRGGRQALAVGPERKGEQNTGSSGRMSRLRRSRLRNGRYASMPARTSGGTSSRLGSCEPGILPEGRVAWRIQFELPPAIRRAEKVRPSIPAEFEGLLWVEGYSAPQVPH